MNTPFSQKSEEYLSKRDVFSEESRQVEILSVNWVKDTRNRTRIGYEVEIRGYVFYLLCKPLSEWSDTADTISSFIIDTGYDLEHIDVSNPVGSRIVVYFNDDNSTVTVNDATGCEYRLVHPEDVTYGGDGFEELNRELTIEKQYAESDGRWVRRVTDVSVSDNVVSVSVDTPSVNEITFNFSIPSLPNPETCNKSKFIDDVGNGLVEHIEGEYVVISKEFDFGDEIRPVTKDETGEWVLTSVESFDNAEVYIEENRPGSTTGTDEEYSSTGVSPVVGTLVMVAVTVVLAVIVGDFVLGLGSDLEATPQASVTFDESGEEVVVQIIDTRQADTVIVDSGESRVEISDIGETAVFVKGEDVHSGGTISVIAENEEGSQAIIQQYDVA